MRATAPGGFSLIELMLAMTILGLGLVMVATMFPVAWSRARSMAEFTTQVNVTKSAEVILQQIARVDDAQSTLRIPIGSFAGTILFYYPGPTGPGVPLFTIERQQRVHALYMENMTVDPPRMLIPDRLTPAASNDFAPWNLERKALELTLLGVGQLPATEFYQSTFGTAQISLEQRVYPALPRRDFATIDLAGLITGVDADWEEELDRRRYAWAILHRLRHEPTDPGSFTPAKYQALAAEPRDLDIYYVTLRRSRPTNRYAVQDPAPNMVPFPIAQPGGSPPPARGLLQAIPPAALPPADDLVLPVPWRIQVRFPNTLVAANACSVSLDPCNATYACPDGETCVLGAGATGVPTEIEVNWDKTVSAPFVIEMFTRGTPFIDEASGKIYRVARRRLAGKNDEMAILTLDREVLREDIDDGFWDDPNGAGAANQYGDLFLIPEELIRTVWVFPPPVESGRGGNGEPIFSGNQPVVGIDVRTLTVYP